MKNIFSLLLVLLSLYACQNEASNTIDTTPSNRFGIWNGQITLQKDKGAFLPFTFELRLSSTDSSFTLYNDQERIQLKLYSYDKDSLSVPIKPYDSELRFQLKGKSIQGTWYNNAKDNGYTLPFKAEFKGDEDTNKTSPRIPSKYAVQFGEKDHSYPAILEMETTGKKVSATFRTETGDYRFLEGTIEADQLQLSCFDGAHAFKFNGTIKGDSIINGHFFSGSTYHAIWVGVKNENVELTHPDSLTKYIGQQGFRYKLYTLSGDTIDETRGKTQPKVRLIQIMGSWCPNCKDETEFLKELHKKYPSDQLETFAAAFELSRDPLKAIQRIKKYKNEMQIPYPIYYGGFADKKKVTLNFPDLDRVISYPTLIVLDKNGTVVKIHTGFNGPATSKYVKFVNNMHNLLDALIMQ